MFKWDVKDMALLKEFKENNGKARDYIFKWESEL